MTFLPLFPFDILLLNSKHPKRCVHNSNSEMERCEINAFQLIKIQNEHQPKQKIKYVTDFFISVGSSRMNFILVNRGEHINVKPFPKFQ